jgi:hypothetical protein
VCFIFFRPYGIFDEKHSSLVGEKSLTVFHVDFRNIQVANGVFLSLLYHFDVEMCVSFLLLHG